jgi:hypothetical protein
MKHATWVATLIGWSAQVANAQPVELFTTRLAFEVWNGSSWSNSTVAQPGERIEYRATIAYLGNPAAISGFASGRYQIIFGGVDNAGPLLDTHAPFRNGGVSADFLPGTMLSQTEAASGASLPSYGRSAYGSAITGNATQNVLTQFRHSDGSGFAPPGDWLRIGGNSQSMWPDVQSSTILARGIPLSQSPQVNPATGQVNTRYIQGGQSIVVFRGALDLGDASNRTITITSGQPTFTAGTVLGAFGWFTNQFGGSPRLSTGFVQDATVTVVPSPSVLALSLSLGTLAALLRRR